jgi:hypothetical protein
LVVPAFAAASEAACLSFSAASAAADAAEKDKQAASEAAAKAGTTKAGTAIGVIILLVFVVFAAFKYRAHLVAMKPHSFDGEIEAMNDGNDAAALSRVPREIPRKCLTKSEKVGEGAFGEVFKGVLDESSTGGVPGYTVACKSVTDPSGDGAKDLLQEAAVMAQVGYHPHLVSLVGVVTSGVPLLLVISFCENGSLQSQLKKRALGEGKLAPKSPGALPPKLDVDIALDIVKGMQCLVEFNMVHRDLAARNVLLDGQLNGKVADFGLSRAYSGESEYYKSSTGMMALRWTAPEAMQTMRFSSKTDVWAFGIVLLEIYTDGDTPIKELTNQEVMAQIQSNYLVERAPKPDKCPADMHRLMCDCWSLAVSNRPSFAQLIERLSNDEFHSVGFENPAYVAASSTAPARAAAGDYTSYAAMGGVGGPAHDSVREGSNLNETYYDADGGANDDDGFFSAVAISGSAAAAAASGGEEASYVVQGNTGELASQRASQTMYIVGGGGEAAASGGEEASYVVQGNASERTSQRASQTMYMVGGGEAATAGAAGAAGGEEASYVVQGNKGELASQRASQTMYMVGGEAATVGASGGEEVSYVVQGNKGELASRRASQTMYVVGGEAGAGSGAAHVDVSGNNGASTGGSGTAGYMDVVGNGKASAGGKMPVAETSFNGFGSGFSDSDDDLEI